jgi:DNA-binding MarR family transcriptional regulator
MNPGQPPAFHAAPDGRDAAAGGGSAPDGDVPSHRDARRGGDHALDPVADLERIVIGAVGLTSQALERAAPGVDLTFSQWRALLILGEPPDGIRVGEVAARVGVTLPATSRLLRRLERRGLVTLRPDETDRRATRARVTALGRDVREAILAFRRTALHEIAEHAGASRPGAPGRAIRALAGSFERYA